MRKLTAALLALLICVCAFASCAGDEKPGNQTGTSGQSESSTAASSEQTTTAPDKTTEEPKPESTREWSDRY